MEEDFHRTDSSLSTRRVRTLVVEDSPLTLRAVVNLLETHPALSIVGTATDGESGMELARRQQPDLVITDLELPGMDGLAIAEGLRKQFPAMRLIVMSIHDESTWQDLSRTKGADAFLSKHKLPKELLALIERLFVRSVALETESKPTIAK